MSPIQESRKLNRKRSRWLAVAVLALATLTRGPSAEAADPCPEDVRFQSNAATSSADFGWTGIVHDQPLADWDLRLGVTNCAGASQPSCGQCDFSGLLPNVGRSNKRCAGNTSIACAVDGDCGGAAPCRFFASSPAPASGGGISFCALNEVTGAVTGTIDIEGGSLAATVPLNMRAYLGLTIAQPCPTCEAGICIGGLRNGLACQIDATSQFGSTSFDCPPAPGSFVGSFVASPVTLATGTTTATLSAASPDCRAPGFAGNECFCDTCNHLAATPCRSDADCAAVGATTCGGNRCLGGGNAGAPCTAASVCPGGVCSVPGAGTRPNQCDPPDGAPDGCLPTGGGEGECADGPFEKYCTIETFRQCITDPDCPAAGDTCNPTLVPRPCFPDNGVVGGSVSAIGAAAPPVNGTSSPALAGLVCIPPTPSGSANSVGGFPGLARFTMPGTLTLGSTSSCPRALEFEGDDLVAEADYGWTGISHDLPVLGWTLRMGVDNCAGGAQPTCGQCDITGLLPNGGGSNKRCAGNTAITCEVDGDCGGSAPCRFFANPPNPVAAGGVGVCLTNQITGSVIGTANIEAGSLAVTLPTQIDIYSGPTVSRPCPTCEAGLCNGGPRHGLACQIHSSTAFWGDTSFDCPPSSGVNIGTLVLSPALASTSSQTKTLASANTNCTHFAFTGNECFCNTCNNAAATSCSTNADCVAAGATICGGNRCLGGTNNGTPCSAASQCPGGVCGVPGEPTRPNACNPPDGAPDGCVPAGECADGPFELYCAIETFRACASNADCPAVGDTCGSGRLRACYPDNGVVGGSVTATGVADPPSGNTANPTIGALVCARPVSASSVNIAAGFPGLVRFSIPATMTIAEEVVADDVGGGGTVTTDTEADGATAGDPVETTLTTPNAGEVVITETFIDVPPPGSFAFFGRQVQISAPPGTVASPLTLVFLIDVSVVPVGEDETTVQVFKNGVAIPTCTGAPQAVPDPCVSGRAIASGDIQLTILTSTGSDWNFGVETNPCPATPQVCRQPAVGQKALLVLKDKFPDDKDLLIWKWIKGLTTTKAEYGNPLATDTYGLCIYDDGALVSSTTIEAGGICDGKPCWAEKTTSFKFKDKELTPDGAKLALLKEGLEDGKAKVIVNGKGLNLEMPSLGTLTGTVDVRLHKSGGGVCWGATYTAPFIKNDGVTFKDKAD